ncbi:MAG: hypothetical protein LIO86_00465 [Lachnospiraceae bacterium]|nr:hypothetical protein [Lachnospiraceae bacterium]
MQTIVTDIGIASILLILGYWLRVKVKLLQKLYIPVAVIGGTIGLLLGPNVLGKVSSIYLPFSSESSGYSTILLAILLSTICLGFYVNRDTISSSINYFLLTSVVVLMQVIVAFGLVRLLQMGGSSINDGFSILPTSGFYGGHGFGAMVAAAFESVGYWDSAEVISLSTTFATIGLLFGVIAGVIIINMAARKGMLKYTAKVDGNIDEEDATGYIQPENRTKIVTAVSKSAAIDPLALQFAFVMAIMACAYGLLKIFSMFELTSQFNIIVSVTVCGIIAAYVSSRTKAKNVMDVSAMKNIGSTAMEILIVISLSTMNLDVVFSYGLEILICSVVILALTTIAVFALGKMWFTKDNFEFSIFAFGVATGVLPTGVLLLKMVDPECRSNVLMCIPAGATFTTIITQMFCMTVAPMIIVSAPVQLIVVMIGICIVMCIVGTVVVKIARKTA